MSRPEIPWGVIDRTAGVGSVMLAALAIGAWRPAVSGAPVQAEARTGCDAVIDEVLPTGATAADFPVATSSSGDEIRMVTYLDGTTQIACEESSDRLVVTETYYPGKGSRPNQHQRKAKDYVTLKNNGEGVIHERRTPDGFSCVIKCD